MKPHRKFGFKMISAAALIAVSLTACGAPASSPSAPSQPSAPTEPTTAPTEAPKNVQIGVSEINLSLPFFVQMQEASEAIAEAYGSTVVWQSADGSIEKQISTIESYIAQQKDAILIDPINAEALVDVINRATQAGIPVVTMGNQVPGDANHNTLYPDHDNFVKQARVLGKRLDGKGKVLFLIGSVGNYVSDTRQAAFEDTMKAEFPGIEVITQPTDFDGTKAGNVTNTVLTNNPDLAAVAAISDGLSLPAIKVLEQAGKDLPVVSCDGDAGTFSYIDDGRILTNILTGSYRVGAWNTAVAIRLARGATFDTNLYMPTYIIASDSTASELSGWGLDFETVNTAKATEVAKGYVQEFGPDRADSDMTVG